MINLFNNLSDRHKGIIRFPEFDYIRKVIYRNIDYITNYYRNGAYAVGSEHQLVKLLYGLSTDTDMDLFDYYRRVDGKALNQLTLGMRR